MNTQPSRPGQPRDDEPADDEPVDEAELDRALAASPAMPREDLRTLLDPDRELRRRTAAALDRTLRSRDTLGAALDLLTLSWWTGRAVLTDDRRPADAEREGR